MLDQKTYRQMKADGACIWGHGTKGQGNGMCGARVQTGCEYCPKHEATRLAPPPVNKRRAR